MTDHTTRADTAARMAQHFETMNRPVKRGNPVGLVLGFAALVAVLATLLALLR